MNIENSITAYVARMIDSMEDEFIQNGDATIHARQLKTTGDIRVNISVLLTPTSKIATAYEAAVGTSEHRLTSTDNY